MYTVGEMAKKIGVAPSTLRYYDKEGLLPFIQRTNGGIRRFQEEDLEWLLIIDCLKKTGMPIKEIKQFIDWCMQGDSTIAQRLELIKRRKDAVLQQLDELHYTLETLEYKVWYYETAQQARSCAIHETLHESEIPPNIRKIRNRQRG